MDPCGRVGREIRHLFLAAFLFLPMAYHKSLCRARAFKHSSRQGWEKSASPPAAEAASLIDTKLYKEGAFDAGVKVQ